MQFCMKNCMVVLLIPVSQERFQQVGELIHQLTQTIRMVQVQMDSITGNNKKRKLAFELTSFFISIFAEHSRYLVFAEDVQ